MHTGVLVHILRNAVEKRVFTVERCQTSALLNAHVSLSFSLDG